MSAMLGILALLLLCAVLSDTAGAIQTCRDVDPKCDQYANICAPNVRNWAQQYCAKYCGLCTVQTTTSTTTTTKPTTTSTTPKPTTSTTTPKPTTSTTTPKPTTSTTTPKPTTSTTTPKPTTTMPTTTTTNSSMAPILCMVCDGPPQICQYAYRPVTCTYPNNNCINHLVNHDNGDLELTRRCGNIDTCVQEWYQGTSDNDRCTTFNPRFVQTLDFECTFCCTTDNCNADVVPARSTLFIG